jgi:hypothetical protein
MPCLVESYEKEKFSLIEVILWGLTYFFPMKFKSYGIIPHGLGSYESNGFYNKISKDFNPTWILWESYKSNEP